MYTIIYTHNIFQILNTQCKAKYVAYRLGIITYPLTKEIYDMINFVQQLISLCEYLVHYSEIMCNDGVKEETNEMNTEGTNTHYTMKLTMNYVHQCVSLHCTL